MKKTLLLFLLLTCTLRSFGQAGWSIDFDTPLNSDRITIDTALNPNCVWQIGWPSKTMFNFPNSLPNVIVTDTLNPYPVNDTSSFTFLHIADQGWFYNYHNIYIGGWYYVNSDTLSDHGYIEYSTDQGNTWYNTDSSMYHGCCFSGPEVFPTLTGNSNGWQPFEICLCTFTPVNMGDTILYRFTFISDSIQTNKDGLMFDNLYFYDIFEDIDEYSSMNRISIVPNPASDRISIRSNTKNENSRIEIINHTGQVVQSVINYTGAEIDVSQLSNGMYLLKYYDSDIMYSKQFVVRH